MAPLARMFRIVRVLLVGSAIAGTLVSRIVRVLLVGVVVLLLSVHRASARVTPSSGTASTTRTFRHVPSNQSPL